MVMDRRAFTFGAAALGLTAASAPLLEARAAPTIGSAKAARQAKSSKPERADVLILGAGASGLQAAWLLEQQGMKVTVLEARQRAGGRIMTLLDQPGTPEMGFNSMADGYGRGIDAAQCAGVELIDVGARYALADIISTSP